MKERKQLENFPFTISESSNEFEIIYHKYLDSKRETNQGCYLIIFVSASIIISSLMDGFIYLIPFLIIWYFAFIRSSVKNYNKGVTGFNKKRVKVSDSNLLFGENFLEKIELKSITDIVILKSEHTIEITRGSHGMNDGFSPMNDSDDYNEYKKTYHLIVKTKEGYDKEIFKYVQNHTALTEINNKLISIIKMKKNS